MAPESGAQFGGRPIRPQRRHVACCRRSRPHVGQIAEPIRLHCAAKLCSERDAKRRIRTGRDRIAIRGFRPEIVRFGEIREVLKGPWTVWQTAAFSLWATSPQTCKYT
jgi:hypothetical protein